MKELKHNQKVPKDIRETLTQNLAEIQGKFSLVLNNPSIKQGRASGIFWVSGLETTDKNANVRNATSKRAAPFHQGVYLYLVIMPRLSSLKDAMHV